MIKPTRHGIWVNRVSSVAPINDHIPLLTGTACDGTFLVEDGKIPKVIRIFASQNRHSSFSARLRRSASLAARRDTRWCQGSEWGFLHR